MRKFKVCYHDNSGAKWEYFEGDRIHFEDKWLILSAPNLHENDETVPSALERVVIAIPTDCVYSVEEIN